MLPSRPVNVSIFLNEEPGDNESLANTQLRCNSDFRVFAERMAATGHTFVVRKKPGSAGIVAAAPARNSAGRHLNSNNIRGRGGSSAAESTSIPPPSSSSAGAAVVDTSPLDIISLDRVEETSTLESTREQWLKCCLREYLQRKRYFEARFVDRRHLILRLLAMLVPCLLVLWWIWPIWDVFLDVDGSYYTTLGVEASASPEEIKRAYRAQIKKWHPDHNPDCGERCRTRVMEMQEAYDTLMERGSKRFDLAKQYHEQILTLRSLITFRLHSIIAESAQGVAVLLIAFAGHGLSPDETSFLTVAVKVSVMLFFILYECLFVSGFNITLIGSVVMFTIVRLRKSAGQVDMERRKTMASVDFVRASVFCIVSMTLLTATHIVLQHQPVYRHVVSLLKLKPRASFLQARHVDDAGEGVRFAHGADILHLLWGLLYVISFLYRFAPNVYDNIVMRKCSLALCYISPATHTFSLMSFLSAELGFIADDVFAFTCQVPWLYRAVVYLVHIIYLCQLKMLPWDGPVIHKRGHHAWLSLSASDALVSQRGRLAAPTTATTTTTSAASASLSSMPNTSRTVTSSSFVGSPHSAPTRTPASLSDSATTTTTCPAINTSASSPAGAQGTSEGDTNRHDAHARHKSDDDETHAEETHTARVDSAQDGLREEAVTASGAETEQATMLTANEALMIANLDELQVHWMDVVSARYAVELDRCNRLCSPGSGCVIQLAYTTNMQTLLICKLRIQAAGSNEVGGKDRRGGGGKLTAEAKTTPPKLEVLFTVYDPDSCRLVAREKGGACVPDNFAQLGSSQTRRRHDEVYRSGADTLVGAEESELVRSSTTPPLSLSLRTSQLWRGRREWARWYGAIPSSLRRGERRDSSAWLMGVALLLFAMLVAQVVWYLSVGSNATTILSATAMLPATMQPRVLSRFRSVLPVTHAVNAVAAGSLMALRNRLVLCTADVNDILHHLSWAQVNRTH